MRVICFYFVVLNIFFSVGAQADVVNFSTTEGYVDGELTSDSRWRGVAGCRVDAQAGKLYVSTNVNPNLKYNSRLAGSPRAKFIVGISFQFSRKEKLNIPNEFSLFRVGVQGGSYCDTAGVWLIRVSRQEGPGYVLRFATRLGLYSIVSGDFIPESDLHGDDELESDQLYLDVQLQKGLTASDWVATASLYNESKDPSMLSPVSQIVCPFESTEKEFLRSSFDPMLASGREEKPIGLFFDHLVIDRFVARTQSYKRERVHALKKSSRYIAGANPSHVKVLDDSVSVPLRIQTTDQLSVPLIVFALVTVLLLTVFLFVLISKRYKSE